MTGLRPLTLFSTWYRLWGSTRLKSEVCQNWINTWWPKDAVGGKKGCEIYDALFPLIEAVTQGQYIVSLDLSLAFDFSHPDIVVPFLQDLGLPVKIACMLHKQWTQQVRYLSFENFVLPTPESVATSLPQGDPWSLLGMVALLTPATCEIARRHPDAIQKNFVDDRSWATRSMTEALQVEAIWTSWNQDLQLQENNAKSQYFHPQQKGRQELIDFGIPASQVSHDIVILGHAFRGFLQRKITSTEDERINKSVALIRRISYLPVAYSMKKRIIAAAPLAKAEFGWLLKAPPLATCKRIQNAIKLALHEPLFASPDLRDILRGHRLNINFRIATSCIGAVRRCLAKLPVNTFYSWHRSFGVGPSITSLLQRFSWSFHRPWVWKHDLTGEILSLNKSDRTYETYTPGQSDDRTSHNLRESFSAHHYMKWRNSTRNDATFCQENIFSAERCKLALGLAKDSRQNFAILTGSFISDAARNPVRPCPFCHQASADTDHAFWNCGAYPPPISRPHDTLLRRLGWPRIGHPADKNHCWMDAHSANPHSQP